jgi:hypothetical protein
MIDRHYKCRSALGGLLLSGITNAAQLKNKLLIEITNAAQHWELKL